MLTGGSSAYHQRKVIGSSDREKVIFARVWTSKDHKPAVSTNKIAERREYSKLYRNSCDFILNAGSRRERNKINARNARVRKKQKMLDLEERLKQK